MTKEDIIKPRILALDPGEKRIGLAISDPFGNFAVGMDTIFLKTGKQCFSDLAQQLTAICQEYEVQQLIIGLPLHMNGSEGTSAQKARELAIFLTDALNLPVTLRDERLTSKIAEQSMQQMGAKPSRKKDLIDKVAATLILQDYLDNLNRARL